MTDQLPSPAQSSLERDLREKYAKAKEELRENGPTIVILGESGVGKSTLVNSVFGCHLARVGNGQPVTQDFDFYPATEDCPVNLYDSKGFELGDKDRRSRVKRFLEEKVKEANSSNDVKKMVHVVWYLVPAEKSRWCTEDTSMIKELLHNLPLLVILSKVDLADTDQLQALEQAVRGCGLGNLQDVIRVAAAPKDGVAKCPEHGDEDVSTNKKKGTWRCDARGCHRAGHMDMSPQGVQELIEKTTSLLPEATRASFIVAQAASLKQKQLYAAGIITTASLAAYAIGWSPIPFSDAPLLLLTQLSMASSLAVVFDVKADAVIPIVIGQLAVYTVGFGAASALKLIPLIGTVIAGAIDSTVAITFTAAIGVLYAAFFSYVYGNTAHATADERSNFAVAAMKKISLAPMLRNLLVKIRKLSFPKNKEEVMALIKNLVDDQESQMKNMDK